MFNLFFNKLEFIGIEKEAADMVLKIQKYFDIDNIPTEHLQHLDVPARTKYKHMQVSRTEARMLVSNLDPNVLQYTFSRQNCTGGKVTYHYQILVIFFLLLLYF